MYGRDRVYVLAVFHDQHKLHIREFNTPPLLRSCLLSVVYMSVVVLRIEVGGFEATLKSKHKWQTPFWTAV